MHGPLVRCDLIKRIVDMDLPLLSGITVEERAAAFHDRPFVTVDLYLSLWAWCALGLLHWHAHRKVMQMINIVKPIVIIKVAVKKGGYLCPP